MNNDDDFLKRLGTSIGVLVGGFSFLYVMIVTTQKPPRDYALKVVLALEAVAKWLVIGIICIGLLWAGVSLLCNHLENKKKEQERLKEERRALEQKLNSEKEEIRRMKALVIEQKQKERDKENRQKELEQARIQKENYLKSRSPEEANRDALKEFL